MKTVQLPATIETQVASSGIDLTEAQTIASNYAPIFQAIAEQEQILKGLEKGNIEHVAIANRASIDLGKLCSAALKQKGFDKEKTRIKERYIDGLYNTTNGYGRLTQETAKDLKDHADNLEKERIAKLQKERSEQLAKFGGAEYSELGTMSGDVWENYLFGTKTNFEAKEAAEAKSEADRLAAIASEKLRVEAQAIENAKLKAGAEAREKAIAVERLKAEEKQRVIDAKAKDERDAMNAQLKTEREAREKLESDIKSKADAEASAKLAAEKEAEKLAKAPVKKQVKAWVDSFEIPTIELDNPTVNVINQKYKAFIVWAKEQSENI